MEVDTSTWTPRVPAKYRDRAPETRRVDDETDALFIDGKMIGPAKGSGALVAVQWVLSGLFDRFPDLRILFAKNQIGWIPFFLQGADARYEKNRHWAERFLGFEPLKAMPSEYLLRHTAWGFQYDRVGVEVRHLLNVDNLIWGSDFPHQESDWPHSMGIIEKAFENAPADVRKRMTCENAVEFFHLKE